MFHQINDISFMLNEKVSFILGTKEKKIENIWFWYDNTLYLGHLLEN